jgi:hypothetical protein
MELDNLRIAGRITVAAVSVALVSGCALYKASPPNPDISGPTTATLHVRVKVASAQTARTCTGRLTWSLTPTALSGSTGEATEIHKVADYSDVPSLDPSYGPQGHSCAFNDTFPNLRTGRWHVEVAGVPTSACDKNLTAGGWNVMSFEAGRAAVC